MPSEHLEVILGAGPVGRALAARRVGEQRAVRIVSRTGEAAVAGVEAAAADVSDADQSRRVCDGASVVYGCIGFDYTRWPERWPPAMEGMIAGAEAAGARFVFMDNLYMYGPVDEPMREDMPLTDYGRKPSTRAAITRMWQDAHAAGRVRAAAVRASDFYGPGVVQSALGLAFERIAAGKRARVLGDPDQPHSYTYVPDVARALASVADADDDAMGQAWHVPNAPACSTREVLRMFADEMGVGLRAQATPGFVLSALGLVNPVVREVREMLYQWRGPFIVDHAKFAARFWDDPTPLEHGVAATAGWYRSRGEAAR